jgi:hypothetical protein
MAEGDMMKTLTVLGKIPALSSTDTEMLKTKLLDYAGSIKRCDNPSIASIEQDLKSCPEHECGISFGNYQKLIEQAETAKEESVKLLQDNFTTMVHFFQNPSIRERLEQGKTDPVIAELLRCKTVKDTENYLIETCLNSDDFVSIVTRYLKKIVVTTAKISDFSPSTKTIERETIPQVVEEFKQFLESKFEVDKKGDTIPVLQLE